MKNNTGPAAILMAMTLAGCMSGGGDGNQTVLSDGILLLELPDQAARAGLSAQMLNLLDEVQTSNENSGIATQPMGETAYAGQFAISMDGSDLIISGTADVFVNPNGLVDYEFVATTTNDPDATVSGRFMGISDAAVSGGLFSGSMSGSINYDEDSADAAMAVPVAISGSVDGAFDANLDAFGAMDGTAVNAGAGIDETFGGVFHTQFTP